MRLSGSEGVFAAAVVRSIRSLGVFGSGVGFVSGAVVGSAFTFAKGEGD